MMIQLLLVYISVSSVKAQTTCGQVTVEQQKPKNGLWLVTVETDRPWTQLSVNCSNGDHKANMDFECPLNGYYSHVTNSKGHPAACKYRIPSVCKTERFEREDKNRNLVGRLALTRQAELNDPGLWKITVNKIGSVGNKIQIRCISQFEFGDSEIVSRTIIHYLSCIKDAQGNVKWSHDNSVGMSSVALRYSPSTRAKRNIGQIFTGSPVIYC